MEATKALGKTEKAVRQRGHRMRQRDRNLELTHALAQCLDDTRQQVWVGHSVEQTPAQRLYGLALGYEDLNDHAQQRRDPLLAAPSTFNRLELSDGQSVYRTAVAQRQTGRHLQDYADGRMAQQGLSQWFTECNTERPHQALGYATPAEWDFSPESYGDTPAAWRWR